MLDVLRAFAPVTNLRRVGDSGAWVAECNSLEEAEHVVRQAATDKVTIDGVGVRIAFADGARVQEFDTTVALSQAAVPLAAQELLLAEAVVEGARASAPAVAEARERERREAILLNEERARAIEASQTVRQRAFPEPFERAGGDFVLDSTTGFYLHKATGFYYDLAARLYFCLHTGLYYRFNAATDAFEPLSPPLPGTPGTTNSVQLVPAVPKLQQGAATGKICRVGAATDAATAAAAAAAAAAAEAEAVAGSGARGKRSKGTRDDAIGVRKTAALNIAKWNVQQQRDAESESAATGSNAASLPDFSAALEAAKAQAARGGAGDASKPAAETVAAAPKLIACQLCKRGFKSVEALQKHEARSKLHADNLRKKAEADGQPPSSEPVYRDRAAERRREYGQSKQVKPLFRLTRREQAQLDEEERARRLAEATGGARSMAAVPLPEDNKGAKMLRAMGWDGGSGLGKDGSGITAPVDALEIGGRTSQSRGGVGSSDSATAVLPGDSRRTKIRKMAMARYSEVSVHADAAGAPPVEPAGARAGEAAGADDAAGARQAGAPAKEAAADNGWIGGAYKTSFSM